MLMLSSPKQHPQILVTGMPVSTSGPLYLSSSSPPTFISLYQDCDLLVLPESLLVLLIALRLSQEGESQAHFCFHLLYDAFVVCLAKCPHVNNA